MSDWVKVRATEIRLAEKLKKEEKERQVEAANLLKSKIEPFWNDLIKVLQTCVSDFNHEFPEAERSIDKFERPSPSGILIRRTVYPAVSVKAQLNNGSTSVNYTISRTSRKGTEPTENEGTLPVSLSEGEPVYTGDAFAHHEDVAKLLLEPFFQF